MASGRDRGDSVSSGTHTYERNVYKDEFERRMRSSAAAGGGAPSELSGSIESSVAIKTSARKKLPVPVEPDCPPMDPDPALACLMFLISDEAGRSQKDRIHSLMDNYVKATSCGFCIRDLRSVVHIMNYLVDNTTECPGFLSAFLVNSSRPVLLLASSDMRHYWEHLKEFLNFLGYLLVRLEPDEHFELAHLAAYEQLSRATAPESGVSPLRLRRAAAEGTTLLTSAARMLALSGSGRFPTYLRLALLMASISPDMCMHMIRENIIENLLYRFNPYFPESDIPSYDINPHDPQDYNVQLGDSSVHLMSVLSLLLISLYQLRQHLSLFPESKKEFKCPDSTSLRCWMWAFRYECRARERRHERATMLAATMALLQCFGDGLVALDNYMMMDVVSLAVQTEVPPTRPGSWLHSVRFDTSRADVEFKRMLIYTSAQLFKTFPCSRSLVESQNWLVGLMYLVDPCLYKLRQRWDEPLFAELRKAALQAMVVVLPLCPAHLAKECGLIRRLLWYIEWYTVSPFETSLLYWSVRVLHAAGGARGTAHRRAALRDLADSHALIIIISVCHKLMGQRLPPPEPSQVVLALCLRVLTSAVELQRNVQCVVYPHIRWPFAVNATAKTMLATILQALNENRHVTQRWTVALLNFIWESIIWKTEYRKIFISDNGIYKILDIVSMSGESVQCIGLALVCEVARAGEALAQVVTWRARPAAAERAGAVVARGGSLAELLAGVARAELRANSVQLHPETGVIQDMEFPLLDEVARCQLEATRFADPTDSSTPRGLFCVAAASLAGSRLSKVYALLQMLTDDLDNKVEVADESYKMYKNISLSVEDQVTLVLCSHYYVCKLGEVWGETDALLSAGEAQLPPEDNVALEQYLNLYKGWAREIKYQQENIFELQRKKDGEEEASLHALLSRCRLTCALDGLRELRHCARAADPNYLNHVRLHEAVLAHHRRTSAPLAGRVVRTYDPPLDDANEIGQHVKVASIPQKRTTSPGDYGPPSCSCGC